jgi:hypothetical protein
MGSFDAYVERACCGRFSASRNLRPAQETATVTQERRQIAARYRPASCERTSRASFSQTAIFSIEV